MRNHASAQAVQNRRRVILIAVLCVLIAAGLITAFLFVRKNSGDSASEIPQEKAGGIEQLLTDDERFLLQIQHRVLCIDSDLYVYPAVLDKSQQYMHLLAYRRYTGNQLSAEKIEEFLKTGTELDGSARIYSNGRHPEIEEYVDWAFTFPMQINTFCEVLYSQAEEYERQTGTVLDYDRMTCGQVDELNRLAEESGALEAAEALETDA